jgi:hypothetical protein
MRLIEDMKGAFCVLARKFMTAYDNIKREKKSSENLRAFTLQLQMTPREESEKKLLAN